MTAKRKQPAQSAAAPSPIGALIARMKHLADRGHRLELLQNASEAGGDIVPPPCCASDWRAAVWAEYFSLEDAVLRSEPLTDGEALAVLLFAVSKAGTLVANLAPPVDRQKAADFDATDYELAQLIVGAIESAAARFVRTVRVPVPDGTYDLVNPEPGTPPHGPSLFLLPPEAELEAAWKGARKGGAA